MLRFVTVLVVLLSVVVVPVAMAADGCAGMGALCGAACSASYACVSFSPNDVLLARAGSLVAPPLADIPGRELKTLDAPPKPLPA